MTTHILVIDPQEGWLRPNFEVSNTLYDLSNWLTRHEMWEHVSVSRFENDEKSPFRSNLAWWKGFQAQQDTKLLEPYDSLPAAIFRRNTYGMPDSYWAYLTGLKVDTLILAGVEADASVVKIAMDAFDRGFGVFAATEFIGSTYGESGYDAGLFVLKKVLGKERLLNMQELERLVDLKSKETPAD